jgi:bifunctional non-homologous end joining protein LigD
VKGRSVATQAKQRIDIDGQSIPLSNPDKILFPKGSIRKAQVIDYYLKIADYILPHLKDRPITLKRYPNGVLGKFFLRKGRATIHAGLDWDVHRTSQGIERQYPLHPDQ